MNRRAYATYRESGLTWLGGLPAHWQVVRLKEIASYSVSSVDKKTKSNELSVQLCNYTDVYYQDRIKASDGEFMGATASSSEIARFGLNRGDVLITKDSEDWQDIGIPALVEEATYDFICGYHVGIVRPGAHVDPPFLFHLIQSGIVNNQLQVAATGVTRYGLSNAAVSELILQIPPLDEQRAIANFLDRETGRIDKLVAKNQLLIERLVEYRTALIARRVTGGLPPAEATAVGLDASPPLKPSGVEWLEDVPAHWDVVQLNRVGSFFKGGGGTKEDEVDGGFPCVRYGDLYTYHQFFIRETRAGINEASTTRYRELKLGDLLFAGSGETIEEIGKSAVNLIEDSAYCGGDVIVFRPSIPVDATYLGYAADCWPSAYQKSCMGRGVTVMHIYTRELKHLLIPFPPLDEQRAIADFLDRETARIDKLASRVKTAIERLQEYRTALITAAVTGEIDVRGEVADETEGLDV